MAEQELAIKINYDDTVTADYLSEELPKYGLQKPAPEEFGEQIFDPFTVALVIGSAYALAHLVVSVIDRYRGGTEVDLTGDQPVVCRNHNLPLGWLLVLAKDGQVKLETKELPRDGLERIVEKVLELGKDAATATIEAALKAVKSSNEGMGTTTG